MSVKACRRFLLLLSLCLICRVLSARVSALAVPVSIPEFSAEELPVVDAATAYLRDAAYADYFYDGRETNQRTVLSLSKQEREALSAAAVGCAALRTEEQTANFPETDISNGSLAVMVGSVELHQKEIAWHAFLNEINGSEYLCFHSPYWRVKAVSVENNVALIEVYELLKFQYIELDDYSLIGDNYLISMVKVADDWLVLSVEVGDEFYEEYCNTGFDLEAKIAEQKRIREREALKLKNTY